MKKLILWRLFCLKAKRGLGVNNKGIRQAVIGLINLWSLWLNIPQGGETRINGENLRAKQEALQIHKDFLICIKVYLLKVQEDCFQAFNKGVQSKNPAKR